MKLIDKDALAAEIEKRKGMCDNHYGDYWNGCYNTFTDILSFINTLEVKEVDLEKEIDNIWNSRFNLGWDEKSLLEMNHGGFTTIAKHFFELGLNTQCKISYVPNIDDSLEELGVDPTSKEAKIFKESYYMALEKLKAQKGK